MEGGWWPGGGSVRPLEYTDGGQEVARRPGVRPLEYTDGGQEVARRWPGGRVSGHLWGGGWGHNKQSDKSRYWQRLAP